MNKKAFFGTIIWIILLFLIITAIFFYVNYKDKNLGWKEDENITNYSAQEEEIEIVRINETNFGNNRT